MHETDEILEYIKLSHSVTTLKWAVLFDSIAVVLLLICNLLELL